MSDVVRPTTPTKLRDMTRDTRFEAQVLYSTGLSYEQVAARMSTTQQQVHRAVAGPTTPRKKTDRPSALTAEMKLELVDCVCASHENRRIPY
jgi:Zn ribbon nucleic-acid-binding protein